MSSKGDKHTVAVGVERGLLAPRPCLVSPDARAGVSHLAKRKLPGMILYHIAVLLMRRWKSEKR